MSICKFDIWCLPVSFRIDHYRFNAKLVTCANYAKSYFTSICYQNS